MDYLNLENSVRNNERDFFLNQGAVTVEVHTQLRDALNNTERRKATRKHLSIHATLIISVLNVMVGNPILASDVDRRIISLQIFQNQTIMIRKFTGTRKRLKPVHTDQLK